MSRTRRWRSSGTQRRETAVTTSPLPGFRPPLSSNFAGARVMPGKRVQFDDETWAALDVLARDRMATFQELADEAFADLLRKHGRPTDLKSALRQSAGDVAPAKPKRTGKE